MRSPRLCIVRSISLQLEKRGLWLLVLAGCLSVLSFVGGFTASRYVIDREMADGTQVLHRSVHAYEAEQRLLFGQWADSYAQLRLRIAAIPERQEVVHHGR